jgi:PTH1 family peptidyl-tRNA hydrolase
MKLIVGLGNPGKEYERNRHNVGFILLDKLAKESNLKFQSFSKANSLTTQTDKFYLCKPLTFMNNSGSSVLKMSKFYKIEPKNIIIIHDDLDLEFGVIKKHFGRGSAGHNGVEDILQQLGTKDFWRVRIGIGRPTNSKPTVDYVLEDFTSTEIDRLRELELNEYILVDDIQS